MSIFRSAPQNGQSEAVDRFRRATGAVATFGSGVGSQAGCSDVQACSPAGQAVATSTRKGWSSVPLRASRGPGRASLPGSGAVVVNAPSTANKSLKFVPALRASTGRG